jgi:hypothetical protein
MLSMLRPAFAPTYPLILDDEECFCTGVVEAEDVMSVSGPRRIPSRPIADEDECVYMGTVSSPTTDPLGADMHTIDQFFDQLAEEAIRTGEYSDSLATTPNYGFDENDSDNSQSTTSVFYDADATLNPIDLTDEESSIEDLPCACSHRRLDIGYPELFMQMEFDAPTQQYIIAQLWEHHRLVEHNAFANSVAIQEIENELYTHYNVVRVFAEDGSASWIAFCSKRCAADYIINSTFSRHGSM